jgi:hypothetical protein
LGSLTIYLNYFIYFGASLTTYFGGSLGWGGYYFLFIKLELFGGILFCIFFGSSICFTFCKPLFKFFVLDTVISYFLIAFSL